MSDTLAKLGGSSKIFGLAPRLTAVLLAVALIPLFIVGVGMIRTGTRAMEQSTLELQTAIVADVTRSVRSRLERIELESRTMARFLLDDGFGTDDTRLALATSQLTLSPVLDWVSVFASDGQRAGTLKGNDVASFPYYESLPPSYQNALAEQDYAVGDVAPGDPAPRLEVAAAVRVAGELRGYVLAGASLAELSSILAEISEHRFAGVTDAVYLVDSRKRLVAHPDPERAARLEDVAKRGVLALVYGERPFSQPYSLTPEIVTPDGEVRVAALESIPELEWAVIIEIPGERAFQIERTMRSSLIAVALVSALLMALVATGLAQYLVRPILRIVEMTRAVAGRNFQARVTIQRSDELGTLALSVNQMAMDLELSEKTLLEQTRIRADLSRYLAPEVVEEVIFHPERMKLGGARRKVTVLFADVAGFTTLSEKLEPETAVALLNELFTIITEIVIRRGGMIDKFIGDSAMAVFGLPDPKDDDADRALAAAEEIVRWMEAGNRRWRKIYDVELRLAIGINSGIAVAGNIGSEKRLEYTVIGDTVNVASRLEGMARPGQILLSRATVDALKQATAAVLVGDFTLSGKSEPVQVWAVQAR